MNGLEDLPEDIRAMAARMAMPDFAEWQKQVRSAGACANPTRMRGYRTVFDAQTGEVLDHYSTDDEPTGYRLVRCGNRRAAVCPSCSHCTVTTRTRWRALVSRVARASRSPETPPPVWATVDLLDDCLRRAVVTASIDVPHPADPERAIRELRFGTQVDTQTIAEAGGGITSRNVARYIAKYVTKGGEITGLPPRWTKSLDALQHLHLPAHMERMVRACFALDAVPAYGEMPFRRWAHMLGYRGHAATKSRRYSVTYGELRDERKRTRRLNAARPKGYPHEMNEKSWSAPSGSSPVQGWRAASRRSLRASVPGRRLHAASERLDRRSMVTNFNTG